MTHNPAPTPPSAPRPRRTLLFKLLTAGFVLLAWFGWVRLYAVLAHQAVLSRYLDTAQLVYIAAGGAVWGLAGLAAAVALWRALPRAVGISRWVAAGCFVWFWLDELLLTRSALAEVNRPFVLIVSLLALAFVWWVPTLPKERLFLQKHRSGRQ